MKKTIVLAVVLLTSLCALAQAKPEAKPQPAAPAVKTEAKPPAVPVLTEQQKLTLSETYVAMLEVQQQKQAQGCVDLDQKSTAFNGKLQQLQADYCGKQAHLDHSSAGKGPDGKDQPAVWSCKENPVAAAAPAKK